LYTVFKYIIVYINDDNRIATQLSSITVTIGIVSLLDYHRVCWSVIIESLVDHQSCRDSTGVVSRHDRQSCRRATANRVVGRSQTAPGERNERASLRRVRACLLLLPQLRSLASCIETSAVSRPIAQARHRVADALRR
jgi:hypothetical protein